MTKNINHKKVHDAIRSALDLKDDVLITDEQDTQALPGWDSLGWVRIINFFEDELNVVLDEVKILLNKISRYRDFIPTEYPQKCHLRDLPDPCHHINDIEGCWRCQARTAVALAKLHFFALERLNENYTIQ